MRNNRQPITTVDHYINQFPPEVAHMLGKIRSEIKKVAPEAIEKISYNIPSFYLNGSLVSFAAYKNHIGFYPQPSAIIQFKDVLHPYKTSTGTVQFSINQEIPYELISKIVRFRVKENLSK